jgi:pterin-4a-carbinolamine dehydratase
MGLKYFWHTETNALVWWYMREGTQVILCITSLYSDRIWVFWLWFFITQSYFKLHLQNTYQLKDQLKKFHEHYFVINKVQCERHEWLEQHQTDIKPLATRCGEISDTYLHTPLWSVSWARVVLSAAGDLDIVLYKTPQKNPLMSDQAISEAIP